MINDETQGLWLAIRIATIFVFVNEWEAFYQAHRGILLKSAQRDNTKEE